MNYIRHLNAFFNHIKRNDTLTASHVSLYLALFQYWNFNRFQNPFPIYRDNIMQLSKIGSKNTYHKCMKELHGAGYIIYHTAVVKYQPVKVSMIRLDLKKEQQSSFTQLDLFGVSSEETQCPNIDTASVPDLTDTCTDNGTAQVPNLGHTIKPNFKKVKTVCNTRTPKNEKSIPEEKQNKAASVPKSVHIKTAPELNEVEAFFNDSKYPHAEAKKFYFYNQGKNWMLNEKLPIADWKSLAHKWMLNAGDVSTKQSPTKDLNQDMQYLFERFLEGAQVSKEILPEYFDILKLQFTEDIKQEALQRRMHQISGTNEYSLNQTLEAYRKADIDNPYLIKDEPNLIALAKRLAVFKHFQQQKEAGKTTITPIPC